MEKQSLSVKTIFEEAIEIDSPPERIVYLDQACAGAPGLRQRVEALLKAYQDAGSFLEQQPATVLGLAPLTEGPGTLIGPYKLLEQIGEGGMGLVFVAIQAPPMRRKVALKIIKPGMDTREVLQRFETERQALALMDHPNIAKVFDGGATVAGRPYFVMELVKGIPITAYCDREKLTTRERLELFVTLCHGVQHAHQKGVIHRDLKPSNVLVEVHDVRPVPKIIDFGIAKATGQHLSEHSLHTGLTQIVGTPMYMSPEQAGQSSLDVDTRSDIYSLGVLLYELLTGQTPFERETFRTAGVDELRRIIREVEPPRPSARVSTLQAADLSTISDRHHAEPRKLSQQLRGDLDWIVMKALEKDRDRRYETANSLAADIERYLHDEPVLAGPPSVTYRMRKFVRRNKRTLLTVSVAALMVLLGVGVIGGSLGYIARDRAVRFTETVRAVETALDEANSLEQQVKWSAALGAVQRAQAVADSQGGNEELRARVQQRIKDLTMVLRVEEIRLVISAVPGEEFDESLRDSMYTQAFRDYGIDVAALPPEEVAQRMPDGAVRSVLAAALDDWALIRRMIKKTNIRDWKHFVAAARATDLDPWRNRLRDAWLNNDRKTAQELLASAPRESFYPSQVILARGLLDDDKYIASLRDAQFRHPADFWLNEGLAQALIKLQSGDASEALGFYRAALALRPESPGVLLNLANALSKLDRHDDAIAVLERAISIKPDYAAAYNSIGREFDFQGAMDKAISAFRKAVALNPDYSAAYHNLGTARYKQGVYDNETETALRQAIRLNPRFPEAHCNLGAVLAKKGDLAGAEEAHRTAVRIDPNHAGAYSGLGGFLCDFRHDYDGAIVAFRRAIELGLTNGWAHCNLGNVLLRKHEVDEAITAYRQAIALDPKNGEFHYCLGNALLEKGKIDEAITACRQAIALNPKNGEFHCCLGEALRRTGKLVEAIEALQIAIQLNPNLAAAHNSLGNALDDDGDRDGAISHYQQAIRCQPDDFTGHINLCIALMQQQSWDGAIAAAREAIRCKPDLAEVHCNLGRALQKKGQLREALEALQRGHELGMKDPNWRYPSARWVQECQLQLNESGTDKALQGVPPPTAEPVPNPAAKEEEKPK